jgi:hypothetical protein
MIDHVDRMIRQLVTDRIGGTVAVSFEPPDTEWRTQRKPADRDSLSVYLVDLRENRRLRSNDRVRTITDGQVSEQPAPRRVDCHYLVSAWSSAQPGPATNPTLDEHALLHRFSSVLANADPFVASRIFAATALPPGFPPILVDAELPVTLLPVEGFVKLAELWGTMGENQPLKPVVYFVVTVPLVLDVVPAGPLVTTRAARFRFAADPSPGEVLFEIGGTVLDAAAPLPDGNAAPVPSVWVDLLDSSGTRLQLVRSDSAGRFTFSNLTAGTYGLRAAVAGFAPMQSPITVPAPDGRYDLVFV